MNCKTGDLAVIVKSEAGNEGKIVRCVKYLGHKGFIGVDGRTNEDHAWEVDRDLPDSFGMSGRVLEDAQLRPIRDPGADATDEMLLIAGKPQEVTA